MIIFIFMVDSQAKCNTAIRNAQRQRKRKINGNQKFVSHKNQQFLAKQMQKTRLT